VPLSSRLSDSANAMAPRRPANHSAACILSVMGSRLTRVRPWFEMTTKEQTDRRGSAPTDVEEPGQREHVEDACDQTQHKGEQDQLPPHETERCVCQLETKEQWKAQR
jgi:hypothetical protein